MVLSTALFNKPAFKNLVCNGLVLADDGKKMSKRLKNYPVSLPKIHPVSRHLLPVMRFCMPVLSPSLHPSMVTPSKGRAIVSPVVSHGYATGILLELSLWAGAASL